MPNYQDLALHFAELAANDSPEAWTELKETLKVRDPGTYEKHIIPYLACRALIHKGIAGINLLAELLPVAPGHIYPMAILSSLWRASEGEFARSAFGIEKSIEIFNKPIPPAVKRLANEKLVSFLDECRKDPEAFYRLIELLHHEQLITCTEQPANQRFQAKVFKIMSNATLKITDRLLGDFEQLLASDSAEQDYHTFLAANPVLLHPLAGRMFSKHKLGSDFVTDFVLETLANDYIAVEIEKPSDPLFTQAGDLTSQFTHAFGQVIDFIEWFEQNIAYAQTKLPGILSPRGLLVIGMRKKLNAPQSNKLRRFNRNSSAIEVVPFDDLLSRSRRLLANVRHRMAEDQQ